MIKLTSQNWHQVVAGKNALNLRRGIRMPHRFHKIADPTNSTMGVIIVELI